MAISAVTRIILALESVFWIFHACLATGRKSIKIAVTQVELRIETNPRRLLLVLSRAKKRQNSRMKLRVTPGNLPS